MKVLGINGSARYDGNTAIMINKVFEELNTSGIETELVQLGGSVIQAYCCGLLNKSVIMRVWVGILKYGIRFDPCLIHHRLPRLSSWRLFWRIFRTLPYIPTCFLPYTYPCTY